MRSVEVSDKLEEARQRQAEARARMDNMIGSGNLNRNNAKRFKEPPLVRKTPRPERTGFEDRPARPATEEEITGDSTDVMNIERTMKHVRLKAQKNVEMFKGVNFLDFKKGDLPIDLSIPVARAKRAANEDGATSFHFSHEAISKTRGERTSSRGTKTRAG